VAVYHLGHHPNYPELFHSLITEPPKLLAFDTEVVSLDNRKLLGVGVAISGGEGFYVPVDEPRFLSILALARDSSIQKIYHNAPFDLRVLRPHQVDCSNVDDTAFMLRLLGLPASLDEAAISVGREAQTAKSLMESHKVHTMDKLPQSELANKCINDAQVTYLLYEKYKDLVSPSYYAMERRLIPRLEDMSQVGVKLDTDRIEELYQHYNREYAWYLTQCQGMGFNPGSPQQVGYILAERENFLPFTKSKKQLSTDESHLRRLSDPVARLVLLYRHTAKLLNTYIIPLRGKDRAYTTFHMEALTGRISSTSAGKGNPDRNLMNIPKKTDLAQAAIPTIRSAFLPDHNEWTIADFSQIELRILAYLSRDQRMLSIFQSPDGDFHGVTASEMRIPRDFAKIFNFAMIYGGNEYTVATNAGMSDVALAKKYMLRWMTTYPQAAQWMMVQKIEGIRNGYVESLLGRKMPIPTEQGRAHAEHCCINFPIQCTAGEIFKMAIQECSNLADSFRLIVHDEMDLSGHHQMSDALAHLTDIYTPVGVEYRARWG